MRAPVSLVLSHTTESSSHSLHRFLGCDPSGHDPEGALVVFAKDMNSPCPSSPAAFSTALAKGCRSISCLSLDPSYHSSGHLQLHGRTNPWTLSCSLNAVYSTLSSV